MLQLKLGTPDKERNFKTHASGYYFEFTVLQTFDFFSRCEDFVTTEVTENTETAPKVILAADGR